MSEIWGVVMYHGVGGERLLRREGVGGGRLYENIPWYGKRLWSAQHLYM